jgi:hypothetical protein
MEAAVMTARIMVVQREMMEAVLRMEKQALHHHKNKVGKFLYFYNNAIDSIVTAGFILISLGPQSKI